MWDSRLRLSGRPRLDSLSSAGATRIIQAMRLRDHAKIVDWPPQPGGAGDGSKEHPQAQSQAVIEEVHVGSVANKSVPLSGTFRGTAFTYDILTKDPSFARKLVAELARHVGKTLQEIGDLDVDF